MNTNRRGFFGWLAAAWGSVLNRKPARDDSEFAAADVLVLRRSFDRVVTWIPVTENCPDVPGAVLVCGHLERRELFTGEFCESRRMSLGFYIGDAWTAFGGNFPISHWAELPKGPSA